MNLEFDLDDAAVVFEIEPLNQEEQRMHDLAVARGKKYLAAEAEILESVVEIDRAELYKKFGEKFLTPYCEKYMGLSSEVAGMFVRVARKSRTVPELKTAVEAGDVTMSKAKTIASVITPENQGEWIEKAKSLSKEKLEREVAAASPGSAKPEKARPVGPDRYRIELELTFEQMEMFRRAQDLVSQSLGSSASLSETQVAVLKCFLFYKDPVKKAERAAAKKAEQASAKKSSPECATERAERTAAPGVERRDGIANCYSAERNASCTETNDPTYQNRSIQTDRSRERSTSRDIPAQVLHAVHLRDQGRCQGRLADGRKCGETRWVHHHHIVPLCGGGTNTVENLITLCSAHHRLWHARQVRSPQVEYRVQ